MKQRFQFCSVLFLMIFLLSSEQMTARISPFKQGDEKEAAELYVPAATASNGISFQNLENTDSVEVLMGLEGCENGDEECPTRRVLSEAHLDYIYTQQHKP